MKNIDINEETETVQKIITNFSDMKFTLIPAGEFMMGSEETDEEKPVHKVTISKPFYLGVHPVKRREWKSIMKYDPPGFKGDDLPAETISWLDVQGFIRTLNDIEGTNKYRLPSEAEWEYAARACTTTRYSFGDDESGLNEYAWYVENSGSRAPEKGDFFGYDKVTGKIINGREKHILSVRRSQIPGDCTIFMAMFGNMSKINGTKIIKTLRLMVVHGKVIIYFGSFVEEAGAASPGTVVLLCV